MTREETMQWYKECAEEIIISQNNKSNIYTGVAISDTDYHTYRVTGDDMCGVINDLRMMLSGTYNK